MDSRIVALTDADTFDYSSQADAYQSGVYVCLSAKCLPLLTQLEHSHPDTWMRFNRSYTVSIEGRGLIAIHAQLSSYDAIVIKECIRGVDTWTGIWCGV